MYTIEWTSKVEKVVFEIKGRRYRLNPQLIKPYCLAVLPLLKMWAWLYEI